MAVQDKLKSYLADHPLVRVSDLQRAGFSRSAYRWAVAQGLLTEIAHGVLGTPEAAAHVDLPEVLACMLTDGVLGYLTAAHRHELTNALPQTVDLIVPHRVARAPSGVTGVRLIRRRDPRELTVGVDVTPVLGTEMRVTSPARTVVDLWRARTAQSQQFVFDVLHRFVETGGSHQELREIAKAFDAYEPIDLFLTTLASAPRIA